MAQVVLKDLNKKYDEVHAVKDVNLTIRDKEFMVFVGPSGCGKTTTLRMIAGLEEITSGEISIGDRVVNDLPPKDRDIAMVFQNYALYPHMTVYDNMAFGLKMRKFPTAEIAALTPTTRVAPRDEPLPNRDAKLRVQMRVELKRLHDRLETTAIYVTHDQVEAMTLGDRVVVMKDGWIQQVGEPLELYSKPANRFVAGFIGSPALDFLGGALTGAGGGPGGGAWPGAAAGAVAEPLGSEILLDLKAGSHVMVARVEPSVRVKEHERLRPALHPERVHFFAPKTQLAVCSTSGGA